MDKKTLIEISSITKTFGKVIANKNVSLKFTSGEIHSILGENGAGKSTLMNMLSGIYTPDSGSIFVKGKKIKFNLPKDSINMGIGMIHQHFKLVDILTAKENIIAGQRGNFFVNGKKLSKEIKEISEKYGLDISPDKKVYDMSVAEKQRLEILKVLYRGADILILDEPTAVLTPQETEGLFNIIRKMKAAGCSVIIITHKLNEVMEISDKITVLRKGEVVDTVNKKDVNTKELADMMVGRSIDLSIDRVETDKRENILELSEVKAVRNDNTRALDKISFRIHSGEILGVAGVAGSGQKELCEAIAGLYPITCGEIVYKGMSIVGRNPREIIKMGISMSFVPEDRLGMGLIASMDIVDNILLKEYQDQKGVFISRKPASVKANRIVEKLNIDTPDINHTVRKLSGGNIQKVLLGREIETNPSLIITAYPARGLDIGAAYTVYDLLNEQKQKGVGILFIGEDLDVLMELCDRIVVMCEGKITGIVDAKTVTKEDLGFMMAGESLRIRNDNLD